MLHSPPMYKAFRPDLQNPTREEAEVVFPLIQGFPIPYVEPKDISPCRSLLAMIRGKRTTRQHSRFGRRDIAANCNWCGGYTT
jgi:hypothetical protein